MPDPVLTLADLAAWSRTEPSLAVLGHPIKHSLSPPMHNAALASARGTAEAVSAWRYFRFDIPPADLPRALELFAAKPFRGLNLTVPHKVIAFDCVAAVDEHARPVGAVNTLLRTATGWRGFNTDGYGLAAALRATLGLDLAGAAVVLLGAGGAARSAAVECLARRCSGLWIANRSAENLERLRKVLSPLAYGIPVRGLDPLGESAGAPPPGAIVINATSAGLNPADAAPLDLHLLARPAAVFDMIYNPARTPLLRQAEGMGIPVANGLAMLAHQGAKALEIWTGASAVETAPVMLAAAQAALAAAEVTSDK